MISVADARHLPLPDRSVDTVVTSPPYWRKRDYGVAGQIGQEPTPAEYVLSIRDCLNEWRRVIRKTGSVFVNVGDTYHRKSLVGIPGLIEQAATADKWVVRNRIIWAKAGGVPDPAKDRLTPRHEYILWLAATPQPYADLLGYTERFGQGDVWQVALRRDESKHLAPYPEELVTRALTLACPHAVCPACHHPRSRIVKRGTKLNTDRPQARRALQLAAEGGLTDAHFAAIRAVGISDAGKALAVQTGAGRNSEQVKALAAEAKKVLKGYFREFTFAMPETVGWTDCGCGQPFIPGTVLDPFAGTGVTLRAAEKEGRSSIGFDLSPP
jgi:DNA modification methylase